MYIKHVVLGSVDGKEYATIARFADKDDCEHFAGRIVDDPNDPINFSYVNTVYCKEDPFQL